MVYKILKTHDSVMLAT